MNLRKAIGRLQHIIRYNEVHGFSISQEKHVDKAIAINVSELKNLIVLNFGDVIILGQTKTILIV